MSERVEKLIREYPTMLMQRECLRNQIRHFKGATESDIIYSMNFGAPEGERVQTSNISDKTCSIASVYKDRVERINREWMEHLVLRLSALDDEIEFFRSAVRALPGVLAPFTEDLVMERLTWDYLEGKYHISRKTVSAYKKRAVEELDKLYAEHDRELAAYILQ